LGKEEFKQVLLGNKKIRDLIDRVMDELVAEGMV
jgi:hypothetical protein